MKRDPLAPSELDKRTGAAGLHRGRSAENWELGTVVVYHDGTHSADVRTMGVGGRFLPDVAQLKQNARDYDMLEPGTVVVISWDLGFMPLIVGTVNIVGRPIEALGDTGITGVSGVGVNDPLQPVRGLHNYRPADAPPDLMSGDKVRVGDRGQSIGVLKGGIAHLGSPTAQVRTFGLSGLLQTVAQRIQGLTDWGQWDVVNDQGKTSFILRAGADQTTQTGMDEQHWTIRIDLGATGDVFNFEITTPEGNTLFRLHVGADGHFQLFGAGGADISSGAGAAGVVQDHPGDLRINVGGNHQETTGKDVSRTAGQKIADTAGTDRNVTVGNDDAKTVNNDETRNIGGNATEVVAGGSAQDAKTSNIAKQTVVLNGGYVIDIGDPSKGANVSAEAAFKLKTYFGDITFESGADLTLTAQRTAKLDGTTVDLGQGTWAMAKWPQFRQDLYQFLTLLLADLQAGTVGTPVKQQLTVLTATVTQLQQFIQRLASPASYDSTKCNNE